MIIAIDNNSGFCFGVAAAVKKAEEALANGVQLFCLGDIVHNEAEVDRLSKMGLITIDHDRFFTLKDTTVFLRAHGEPPRTYEYARQNNIQLIDATCPIVLKLQQRIRSGYESGKENGTQVIIFGKKGHAEVNGLVGQTDSQAIVIESSAEIDLIDLNRPIELYAQTTKELDGFHQLANLLKSQAKEDGSLRVHDTICRQVSNRIPGIKEFSGRYAMIIFVSGQKSSNGKMLFDICKSENPNSKFISSVEELESQWFNDLESVGICGATSTPKKLLEEIAGAVRQIKLGNLK